MADKRIRMTQTQEVEFNGSPAQLRGGEYYLLPADMADGLVEKRLAYPDDEPPECDKCGATFEGVGAWTTVERHRGEDHQELVLDWKPGEGEPPPLDEDHPAVQEALEEYPTIQDLKGECNRIGVADDEVVATGASGKLKEDWLRHLLRARGRRGFYRRRKDEES